MAKVLRFVPPPGTLKRLLQRSIELHGGKLTGVEATPPRQHQVDNNTVTPLFGSQRRRRQIF
jgi:hypothetical protein